MSFIEFFGLSVLINLAVTMVLWMVSLVKRNVTVVDPFWGLGFVIMVGALVLVSPGATARTVLVVLLATAWGLRYGLHLYWRPWGHAEDTTYYPYKEWRDAAGSRFWWISFFKIFLPQAIGISVIGLPILVALFAPAPGSLTAWDLAGTLVWAAGFSLEAIADYQLGRFKHDPANRRTVMSQGLWRYSRHPNYFGDAVLWWGFFLIATATPSGWFTIVSPLLMTYLLVRVSGVAMVEKKSVTAGTSAYQEYAGTTSAFVPWFPRKRAG